MDVLIEGGGSVHRLSEGFATLLAENLRAFSNDSETAISAADKLERVLVEGQSEPLAFTRYEASTVAECVDHMGHKDSAPEELALFWALRGLDPQVPEFFVPHTESPEQAEEVWQATRRFAEEQLGWGVSDRRIFRVEYMHDSKEEEAEVGKIERRQREPVMVILESQSFLVCTPTRGVAKGEPILIGIPRRIVDFD